MENRLVRRVVGGPRAVLGTTAQGGIPAAVRRHPHGGTGHGAARPSRGGPRPVSRGPCQENRLDLAR